MPLRSRCLDLVGVDCFQLSIKRYTLGFSVLWELYGPRRSRQTHSTHALNRSVKHMKMRVYRASVPRGVGKQP